MTTYRVTAQRSDGWWAFSIPEIPGAHGQAKRLDQVPAEALDVIALMLDLEDVGDIEVIVDVELDASLEPLVTQAHEARQRLDATQREAQGPCASPPSGCTSAGAACATSAAC